jgi:hypothetical protein
MRHRWIGLPMVACAVLAVGFTLAQTAFGDQPSVVVAGAGTSLKGEVGSGVDNVAGSAVLNGTRGFFFNFTNQTQSTITNATVTMTSGWNLSYFPGIATLPVSSTTPALGPGESSDYLDFPQLCCTLVPSSFSEGFDSVRSVQPVRIGSGGGTQTVQISLTLTDPTLASRIFGLNVDVQDPSYLLPGVTLVSSTGPTNLDQGETLSSPSAPGLGADWWVFGPKLGKTYTFTYTLSVPDQFGVPLDFKPPIHINAVPFATSTTAGPSTSVSIPVSSLDGSSPGSGGATFSVDQSVTWQLMTNENHELEYDPLFQEVNLPTSKEQCKDGGWQAFGVFKDQGDCVSYVATGGKNPPNG